MRTKFSRAPKNIPTLADAVADCTLVVGTTALGHRELQHPLRTIEYGGRVLQKHLTSGPAALLFGSEKFGLSNDDLSHCHWLVRIGTQGSMNLGQAVAVCLYELTRTAGDGETSEAKARARRGFRAHDGAAD